MCLCGHKRCRTYRTGVNNISVYCTSSFNKWFDFSPQGSLLDVFLKPVTPFSLLCNMMVTLHILKMILSIIFEHYYYGDSLNMAGVGQLKELVKRYERNADLSSVEVIVNDIWMAKLCRTKLLKLKITSQTEFLEVIFTSIYIFIIIAKKWDLMDLCGTYKLI